jgi:hypothetical protein
MMFDREKLERLRAKFGEAGGNEIFDPHFRAVADSVFKDLSSIGDRAVSIAVQVGLRCAIRPQASAWAGSLRASRGTSVGSWSHGGL